MLLLTYGLVVIAGLISEAFIAMGFYPEVHHEVIDLLEPVLAKERWAASDWIFILFIIISVIWIAPLLEEVTFRLFLRYRLQNVLISLTLQLLFFASLFEVSADDPWVVATSISIGLLIGSGALWLARHRRGQVRLRRWWHRQFPLVYYYSAIAFGVTHFAAYGLTESALWFTPIILLPIIVMGLTFGFVRIRYGMWYAILLHSAINIIGITAILLTF